MKKFMWVVVAMCCALVCADRAATQESGAHKPPKILEITREWVKPGKAGAPHEKAESLYREALTQFHAPVTYIGMTSLSGKPRALFFEGFASFEEWRKRAHEEHTNAPLDAALDHADQVDGELLEGIDHTVWYLNEDQSFNTSVDLPHIRYFELERFTLRQGHDSDWNEAVKLVKAAYEKALPDAHWAMYSAVYGIASPTHLVITPLKSGADIDTAFASNPKFAAAMGEEGMKKLDQLASAAIESSETNLFQVNPRMSHVGEDMEKADPDFWRPKAAASAAKKPAAKP
jgi:hypothetical protein